MSSADENRTGSSWLPRRPETGVARPERPALSDRTPAPVTGKAAVPLALRRSQAMFYVAVALLFFSVVMIVMTRASITTSLTELLHEQDATVSETRLADVAPLIVYVAIAALLVVAIPEWVFATVLSRRRPWPRIIMVPVAIVHVFVAVLCTLLIPTTAWQGWLLVGALVFGGLLALIASVRSFAPSVSSWLRTRHEDEAVDST
ncbi:MAG TPA: hypothetical protein VIE19_03290 [Lapillicoccus sp.]|jgi:hypothetical protein